MAEYIDREKIREEVCKDCTRRIGKDGCMEPEACEDLLMAFVAAEPANVAPVVHASWEFKRKYGEADECVCSVCGQLLTTKTGERMKHCPNCGARMDKEA